MKLYLNGLPVATNVIGPQPIAVSSTDLRISGLDNHVYFDGLIDEPSVYNRALSDGEIAAIYSAGSAGKCWVPVITSQPQGQTAVVGSTVTFIVTAGGTPALSYQWQFDSTNIAGATASSLTLTNVQPGQAGNYLVIVSNALGVVTSSNAVLAVVSSPSCATPPAGLVGWWPGEGNAVDIAGTNNGTLLNGATFSPGEVGSAFSLDGVSAVVEVPDSPTLSMAPGSALTVELWAYRTTTNSLAHLLGKRIGCTESINYQMAWDSSGLNFGANAGNGVGTGIPLPLRTWTHLAATFEAGTYSFYINGQLVATSTNMTLGQTNDAPLEIGQSGTCELFGGLLDEVSIYNRALSASEIAAIYSAGSAGKCRLPRVATASAVLTYGFVVAATLTDGGYGYTNTPTVKIIGGGGSGAQAVAVVSNGVVIAVNFLDAGSGYTNAPLVVIDPPFIPNPVLGIAPVSFLAFSNLTLGGVYQLQQSAAWYWSNQPVSFTATNALYTQMVEGVASVGDYRLALNPVPAQAFATAQVDYGFVVLATVTSSGSGYVASPAVTIIGGGGSNATAVANLSGGVVTSITITDAGIGYTNAPTVRIAPPPAAAVSPTVLPMMRVDSASVAPYDNYQIQFKPDLGGAWGNWNGGLFSPTDVTNSQYVFITNGVGFFRLQYLP
jgi:hypothetical protein